MNIENVLVQSLGIIIFLSGLLSGFLGTLLVAYFTHLLRKTEIELKSIEDLRNKALIETKGSAVLALKYREVDEPYYRRKSLIGRITVFSFIAMVLGLSTFFILVYLPLDISDWIPKLLAILNVFFATIFSIGLLLYIWYEYFKPFFSSGSFFH